jgi:diguanylate cyclase (GGDEF)-like protein
MARTLPLSAGGLLLLHIGWGLIGESPSQLRDLFVYNAIWFLSLLAVIAAPLDIDRSAIAFLAVAISFWGMGSLLSSLEQFEYRVPENAAEVSYCLFYPPLLIALSRIAGAGKLRSIEVLDAIIFSLGFTSILTTIALLTLYPEGTVASTQDFFLLFYPVGDVLLLLIAILQLITRGWSRRIFLFTLAVLIFSAADSYFLYLVTRHQYSFGQFSDDLWLIAIVLFALSLYTHEKSSLPARAIPAPFTAVAIFSSPVLLAISALNPGLIPYYLLFPSIANILLALIRMNTALREERALTDERRLARTDELTGLPNRRRMLAEIDSWNSGDGALMLLDLDGFKPINDRYGHAVGDQILREVARRFSRALPEGSLIARLGGDEFGVLAHGESSHTLELAYALRACLSYPFLINGVEIKVGVSIGYVANDGEGDLLKRADIAMYRAKSSDVGVVQSLSL